MSTDANDAHTLDKYSFASIYFQNITDSFDKMSEMIEKRQPIQIITFHPKTKQNYGYYCNSIEMDFWYFYRYRRIVCINQLDNFLIGQT